jgi:hypothetical protein
MQRTFSTVIEIVMCFDAMGGASRDDLADEISMLVGDPLYLREWFETISDYV